MNKHELLKKIIIAFIKTFSLRIAFFVSAFITIFILIILILLENF